MTVLLPPFQADIVEVILEIPNKFHNSIIGAKGRLIRSVMEECGGVTIRFPPEGTKSDKVIIRGPKDDVEKARRQLIELSNERVSGCEADQDRILMEMYRKTSNISRTLVGNKIVDNSDVVGASPVGAAPTTSSFST